MKNKDVNNQPVFLFILSVFFLGVGLAGLIFSWNADIENKTLILVAFAIFAVVGLYLLVYGIIRAVKIGTVKRLINNPYAFVTDATFVKANISSYSSTHINHIPTSANVHMKITYEYVDEMGEKHVVKSISSYYPKQVEYLRQKGTFKIKCDGKYSDIIEKLPEANSRYNIR